MIYRKRKNELTVSIGKNIALLRKKAGLSQQEVEDKAVDENGEKLIKYRTLSLIEQGYGEPKITTLNDIAKALGVPLIELFRLDKTQIPNQSREKLDYAVSLLKEMDNKTLKIAVDVLQTLTLSLAANDEEE